MLLERRFGHVVPVVIFVAAGAAGAALSNALDVLPAVGANGAALGLLCAWLVDDRSAARRGDDRENDLHRRVRDRGPAACAVAGHRGRQHRRRARRRRGRRLAGLAPDELQALTRPWPSDRFTDEELDAALKALTEPERFREAEARVARIAPQLQHVLYQALDVDGYFSQLRESEVAGAVGQEDLASAPVRCGRCWPRRPGWAC